MGGGVVQGDCAHQPPLASVADGGAVEFAAFATARVPRRVGSVRAGDGAGQCAVPSHTRPRDARLPIPVMAVPLVIVQVLSRPTRAGHSATSSERPEALMGGSRTEADILAAAAADAARSSAPRPPAANGEALK